MTSGSSEPRDPFRPPGEEPPSADPSAPPPYSSAPPPYSSAPPPYSSAPPPYSSAPPPYEAAPPAYPSAPPADPSVGGYAPSRPGTDGFAIAALVCGIVGAGLFALIFGIIALVRINRSGQQGRGLAIAGIVLSVVWIIAAVVALAFIVSAGTSETGALTIA